MSSDALHHNQQLLHNRYEYEYHIHNGYTEIAQDYGHAVMDCHHHDEELERQSSVMSGDAIIRGNMQYINGELRKIPRPLNAFMIFSNEKRKELKKEFPGEPNNMISSRLGAAWKGLSDEARKKYHDMAHREDLEHRRKYPNYQYCPGHARKLKKARREQRLRQQGMYRGARQPARSAQPVQATATARRKTELVKSEAASSTSKKESASSTSVKKENTSGSYTASSSPSTATQSSSSQVVHGMGRATTSSGTMATSFEGRYVNSTTGFPSAPEMAPECMLTCCSGCKAADVYCCPESHWNGEGIAGQSSFTPGAYPPPMFYFSPGFEPQFTGDALMPQPCLMSGDCNTCYPTANYMDGCYGPLYPAGGDASMCFVPELPLTTSPTVVTSASCTSGPMTDGDAELTDISNSMMPSNCSHDGQSDGSISPPPSTLQDVSSASSLSASDIPLANDM